MFLYNAYDMSVFARTQKGHFLTIRNVFPPMKGVRLGARY